MGQSSGARLGEFALKPWDYIEQSVHFVLTSPHTFIGADLHRGHGV